MTTIAPSLRVNSLIWIAVLAACALISGPALSQGRTVDITVHVSAEGLDLNQPAGADQLIGRLQHAARIVCGHGMRVDLEPLPHPTICFENAVADAVRSINRPQLTKAYLKTHSLQDAANRGIDVQRVAAAR